jgi:hypothetical protein
VAAKASHAWISDLWAGEKNKPGLSRHTLAKPTNSETAKPNATAKEKKQS